MNAVIKITGVQGFMQPDAETVEFVTDGVYCRTEDGYQIFYHESALTARKLWYEHNGGYNVRRDHR